jgi:hypothetical protein
MGDSEPRPGNDSELERGRADIADAMDVLQSRGVATRFVLIALCSGVDSAHVVARDDSRVVAAAFIDGYAHRTTGWYLRQNTKRYLEPRRWQLLFQRAVQRIRNGAPRPKPPPIYTRQYPDVATLEHDYGLMVDRHLGLLFVFTGGMEPQYNYAGQFFEMFQRDFRPHVQVEFLRRADHVFFNSFERERLLKRLVGWITDTAGAAPLRLAANGQDE